ncbi:B3/4 domain protein [Phytobacter ursingii]|nr:B3/4 domain protein [Phytobacter ursingii]
MLSIQPSIDAGLAHIAPQFRALSMLVEAAPLVHPQVGEAALTRACAEVMAGGPVWAQAHLDAWSEVFKRFGAKPKRTPCSADALRKRVLRDGVMAAIDPVVDLYNAISLRYAIPVGGENLAAYAGAPRLVIAEGTERFDMMKDGHVAEESPEPGEVVWRDDLGVTCRRWNWRQGVRTRLSATDSQMWFILESLPEMPLDALHAAGDELAAGLQAMMPGSIIRSSLLTL